MAVVETLEIRFQANLGKLSRQLALAAAQLATLGGAAEQVQKNFEAAQAGCAEAGRGIVNAICGELKNGRQQIGAEGRNTVLSAASAMQAAAGASSAPGSAGRTLSSRFSSGILAGRASAAAAAASVVSSANFAADASSAFSAGANLSSGFANGILSRMSAVIAAANRVASAAVSRIQSALKIHSPSKVAFEMGAYFGDGFAGGVRASVRRVRLDALNLSEGASSALSPAAVNPASAMDPGSGVSGMMRSAVQEALGGTSFVIPLHVDGVKLGEASIRGINRVTRSAGRLMLEI